MHVEGYPSHQGTTCPLRAPTNTWWWYGDDDGGNDEGTKTTTAGMGTVRDTDISIDIARPQRKKIVVNWLGKWTTNVFVNFLFICHHSLLDLCISTNSPLVKTARLFLCVCLFDFFFKVLHVNVIVCGKKKKKKVCSYCLWFL